MTDNARIVERALYAAYLKGVDTSNANVALTAIETELSAAQAELERAREEERERIIAIITDPENLICWLTPLFGHIESIHADPRFIRAALAPEQKDQTNKENS